MTSLVFEIPVMIGAAELSRIILFDPLFKIAFPYFKTTKNDTSYTKYFKFFTAATLYYLLFNNFSYLPIYFLHVFVGAIIVFAILCFLTPLWEILMTSFKFTDIFTLVKNKYSFRVTSSVEDFNDAILGDLIVSKKRYNNENERKKQFLQLGMYLSKDNTFSSILKKSKFFNQKVQQNARSSFIIIMNANVLVKLTRLLSITPLRSKSSRNIKFLPTYVNERVSISRHRRNSLLICDSQVQIKEVKEVKEVHVAPPGDLFLSEKINELDKKLVDLNEHENAKQLDNQIKEKIRILINQKRQYQVQAKENIISKGVTKLSIPAFTIKGENYKKFAAYIIMVQRLDASTGKVKAGWIIPRRYNEFSSLNQHLKKQFVSKFELPGKTLFSNFSNSFLESRRIQLENYLQSLLTKDEICENREFLKFLSKEN